MYYTDKILHLSGAPRARQRSLIAEKILSSIHPRKFDYDVSVRPPVRTDAGRGGRKSEVSPSGEEYVIAEEKFCIPSTSLVSVVNHIATRPGLLEEKTKQKNRIFLSTKFNVSIKLDNRERAKAKKLGNNGD